DSKDIKVNPMRPLADLDKLPWPLREGLPMDRYNDTPGDMPIPSVQIYASRGCPYRCKFCLWPQVMYQGNHYRTRDIVDVVNEMEYLVKEMHFKSIYFDDDTFNVGKERMLRLSDEIKARGLNIPWAIMARADLMDLEILERMRDAGLFAVKYGVESATQEHLDRIDKNMDLKKTEEVIKLTKRLGIKTHLTFTFGLPGETKESIKKTIDMALKLDSVTVQFSIATPFPGTAFYREMKEKGQIVSENWDEYDGNHKSVVAFHSITKKDLEEAIRSAYRQWAIHCARRNPFKKAGYLKLALKSLKKYGFFVTILKIAVYFMRYIIRFFKEKILYKNELEQRIKEKGLKIGRLSLLSDPNGLNLYWDGMRLTKGGGFASALSSSQAVFGQLPKQPWCFEKINDTEILLIRKQGDLGLDEIWKIKVIDEKQIDWDVDILLKNKIEALAARIQLVLTGRYRTWIDSWGEGRLYPVNDHRKVGLRNPNTDFIGLRGRKKLKGQLPTFFLDLSRNRDKYSPSIKNASSVLGARVLEVQSKFSNGNGEHASSSYNLFSMRIKIVEEDFNKRSLNKKK
ncbi:MAG: radical SAM protein, partial [Candidatus Omnitrophica bacterium]|nr:radical SAM protein [Candidatus Omnitrophota bacterium]